MIYPRKHRRWRAHRAHGALVSEFPPGTPASRKISAAQPHHRRPGPRHAGRRSGLAFRLADHRAAGRRAGPRSVCDPGSIHNPLARGCHQLIRDGAMLVERPTKSRPRAAARSLAATGGSPTPRRGRGAVDAELERAGVPTVADDADPVRQRCSATLVTSRRLTISPAYRDYRGAESLTVDARTEGQGRRYAGQSI